MILSFTTLNRNTVKNDTRYYIRDIKNMFTVGQTYPVTEVPGPHSRKYTNTVKYRLQVIAFKLLQKSVGERLKIGRLMKYFPDQNELQMRQRLKVRTVVLFRYRACSCRSIGVHGVSPPWPSSRLLASSR